MDISRLVSLLRDNDIKKFKSELKRFNTASLNSSTIKNKEHDAEEYTIMELTIIHGNCEFVDALLEVNVNPNLGARREQPILLAARYGHHKILERFMKSNVKQNDDCQVRFDECNSKGENVLHLGKYLKIHISCLILSFSSSNTKLDLFL